MADGELSAEVESVAQTRLEPRSVNVTSMPGNPPAAGHGASAAGLTRREYEVAVLVAGGLSNRQVAEQLLINEKTAKNHVQRVLEKLGVNSRRQIIARAHEFSKAD
jgi:DNA-binding CsgD family transcriptional regulator